MRVLIIGCGGREHALAWKLEQSPLVEEIHVAPGNGGTARWRNAPIKVEAVGELVRYALEQRIDLVLPGGETSLALGISDACRAAGLACFGPDAQAARLESSKTFAKTIMTKAGIPTALGRSFTELTAAAAWAKRLDWRAAIKADGLAGGKGVVVARNKEEVMEALEAMLLHKSLGQAGESVLVEELLEGEEVSLLAFCDGQGSLPLPSAQDHKRAFDNDLGPNTGGMGAYSPAPMLPEEQGRALCALVIDPVLRELAAWGHPFRGVLYAGLMLTQDGPKVLEYNVRFGDPECQALLPRLQSDLAELLLACLTDGGLEGLTLRFDPRPAVCVVLAARGYPGKYLKGLPLRGLEEAVSDPSGPRNEADEADEANESAQGGRAMIFQAGTRLKQGRLVSDGGRVLGVTCLGDSLELARRNAYDILKRLPAKGFFFRRDIGRKGVDFLRKAAACRDMES